VILQNVLCTKPGGNGDRRRSRPNLRWCNEIEEDITEVVGCRNWRINVQSRQGRWKLTKEVKSHPVPMEEEEEEKEKQKKKGRRRRRMRRKRRKKMRGRWRRGGGEGEEEEGGGGGKGE